MTDYQLQAPTRRCVATGRELRPGERYYTALVEEGGKFVRQDFSAEAWQGPPANAFGSWAGRVAPGEQPRRPRFDDDLLFDCFQRLEGRTEPSRVNFRYVVALLLMRRKRLRFEESRRQGEQEVMLLRCARTGTRYEMVNPQLNEEQMEAVREEVFKVLGWE